MKVKALIKYTDKVLNQEIEIGDEFEVDTEERLQELLGNNKKKLVCVQVIERDNTLPTLDNSYTADKLSKDITSKSKRKINAKRK